MSPFRTVVRRTRLAHLGRMLACALAVSTSILTTGPAAAAPAQGPPDIASRWGTEAGPTPVLPEPPSGYRAERHRGVQWVYPDNMGEQARELQATFEQAWPELERDFGTELDRGMVIRVARSPEHMRALAPRGHPPPDYATGVAYPPFGVVLLTMTAPESWERPDIESVLTHELSHVALWRAVDGHPLPRWFVEGVALHQAGEYSLPRTRVLWEATVRDDLIPLPRLSEHFPSRPYDVNVAYAQSADVVNFLRKDEVDTHRFQKLIERLRQGESFKEALRSAYFVSVDEVETEWHANLQERFQALPLVLSGGTVWALAGLFVIVGYVRRKRRAKRKIQAWEQEEAAVERLERAAEAAPVASDPDESDEDERMVVVVSGDPPQGREPDVPTIEYEGRDHTLH